MSNHAALFCRDSLQRQLDQQEADLGAANTEACVLLQMCMELQKQAAQQQAIAESAVSTAEADRSAVNILLARGIIDTKAFHSLSSC